MIAIVLSASVILPFLTRKPASAVHDPVAL